MAENQTGRNTSNRSGEVPTTEHWLSDTLTKLLSSSSSSFDHVYSVHVLSLLTILVRSLDEEKLHCSHVSREWFSKPVVLRLPATVDIGAKIGERTPRTTQFNRQQRTRNPTAMH